ncbi:phytoene desaturase [Corynebacterium incognita]|uniref:Phytoene desaturase n=1 Tax=Corynebacterium incognita TaxID=2754725 RepID=A0A7G7CR37_9CORY|nr:phytoene desaturase family protein [Corynebacterium incognita]QNE90053.1 phytoene desaturase [Corynebacterium incognita]
MKIAVIGAGVAGLAAAGLLARDGHEVTVYEKGSGPGGRAGSLEVEGFRFDTGPSWYLMPEAFDHFFEQMGTTTAQQLDLVALEPGYRVATDGHPPVDVHPRTIRDTFDELEPGSWSTLDDYLRRAADIYDLALRRFLYTDFRSPRPFLDREVLRRPHSFINQLLAPLSHHVRRQFTHPVLRQILEYPAVFLATRPDKAPALYHLMSHTDLTLGPQYPQGGFATLVDALYSLARQHGARFEFATAVDEIRVHGKQARGVMAGGVFYPYDAVVSAADYHFTQQHLLATPHRSQSPGRVDAHDPGMSSVLVMLGVRGETPELAHHTLQLSADWDADFDAVFGDGGDDAGASRSIYISRPSATDPDVAPAGHENLFILVPVPADPSIGRGSAYADQSSPQVEAIADAAVSRVAELVPDLAERIVVRRTLGPGDFAQRYNSFMGSSIGPAHTLAQSAMFRAPAQHRKVRGLYYAGGTVAPGVGVPMCLISAENARDLIRRAARSA